MRRILFVDDEPRILEGLQDRLIRYRRRWDMSFVESGDLALQAFAQKPFDVIVSDMRMPGMDGATLLTKVKDRYPETVRIVLSGYSELEAAMRAVPVAHQFLSKPCDPQVLENVIERANRLQQLIADEPVRRIVGEVQNLPSLPTTYSALLKALANENAGARDVARILERDVAMTAKTLQLVNSAFFGLGRQIVSIDEAVSYLGFTLVKNLVLTVEVFAMSASREIGGLSLEATQRHSLAVADVATRLLGEVQGKKEDTFIAAVLHDIGKLVLAGQLPEKLADVRSRSLAEGRPQHEVERERMGTTHAEIGGYLLGLWGLPYPVVEAVANHHEPARVQHEGMDVLTAVHVANALVQELAPDGEGLAHSPPHLAYLESIGLADRMPEWRAIAAEQARSSSSS
jgi:putative nucleotidyltransferase with HDIG domain